MPLIPALISANEYYKYTKDRLAKEAAQRQKMEERELAANDNMFGGIHPSESAAFTRALRPVDMGPLPTIPKPQMQLPEYQPKSKRQQQ